MGGSAQDACLWMHAHTSLCVLCVCVCMIVKSRRYGEGCTIHVPLYKVM